MRLSIRSVRSRFLFFENVVPLFFLIFVAKRSDHGQEKSRKEINSAATAIAERNNNTLDLYCNNINLEPSIIIMCLSLPATASSDCSKCFSCRVVKTDSCH
jgi:hypothetical protein